ncbi:MAG: DUF4446 family protein [Lachnospiraceae bacterium]|jgi:hypothetical protein|nr:DUF4446 family protein [Lachnospiraceae bacterium]
MEDSILNHLGIDPLYIIFGQAALTIVLMIIVIICIFKIKKLYRSYDYFMRGKDAETLEDIIIGHIQDIQELKSQDRANKDQIRVNNKNMRASFQKFGMVRYNAFKGMGGNLSFAFALLDYTNTGFVMNSVHSREGCYLYLKAVDRGQTEILLGNEEKEALEQALGYKE